MHEKDKTTKKAIQGLIRKSRYSQWIRIENVSILYRFDRGFIIYINFFLKIFEQKKSGFDYYKNESSKNSRGK